MSKSGSSDARTALVVVAGGRGRRFGALKQFAHIAGEPLLLRTLRAFDSFAAKERIVVLPEDETGAPDWQAIAPRLTLRWRAVAGGETRADSVRNGATAASAEFVAVHDAARPFPPLDAMRGCLARLIADSSIDGAIVCAPVTDTLKRIAPGTDLVSETVPREELRRAETPQCARRAILLEALARPGASGATDEAMALERHGRRVALVLHAGINLKVTTPADIAVAERLLAISQTTPGTLP